MAKKRKLTMQQKVLSWVKTGAKAATHTLTFAGVIVATSPVHRGITTAAGGHLPEAGIQLMEDTTGARVGETTLTNATKAALIRVAIPLGVGIGLVAAGAILRRRIGN